MTVQVRFTRYEVQSETKYEVRGGKIYYSAYHISATGVKNWPFIYGK